MLFLFNTFSVRLSASMKMAMMKLNKTHVFVFCCCKYLQFKFNNPIKKEGFLTKT